MCRRNRLISAGVDDITPRVYRGWILICACLAWVACLAAPPFLVAPSVPLHQPGSTPAIRPVPSKPYATERMARPLSLRSLRGNSTTVLDTHVGTRTPR